MQWLWSLLYLFLWSHVVWWAFTLTFLSNTSILLPPSEQKSKLTKQQEDAFLFACLNYSDFTPKTQWPESARELYRPSDRRLSTKLLPTFADRGCHVIIVTDPYGRILGFLERGHYSLFQVAPQLYLRGWVDRRYSKISIKFNQATRRLNRDELHEWDQLTAPPEM
jgi:hypothetical protein